MSKHFCISLFIGLVLAHGAWAEETSLKVYEPTLSKEDVQAEKAPKNHLSAANVQNAKPSFEWNPPLNDGKTVQNSFRKDPAKLLTYQKNHIDAIEYKKRFFFQSNIGIGFLYFAGVKGNLMLQPRAVVAFRNDMNSTPIKGRLSYNATPIYEYQIGWRATSWLNCTFSYQYQGGVSIQTPFLAAGGLNPQFISSLYLNGLLAKLNFELPYPFIFGKTSISPFLGIGVGPSWQSWTNPSVTLAQINKLISFRGDVVIFKNKNSPNALWMFDLGIRMQRTTPYSGFNLLLGVKYNQWGQARNIGKYDDQSDLKIGLFKPFSVRTVYQWAPYLGAQWNFSPVWASKTPYSIQCRQANSWKPFLVPIKTIEGKRSIFTQFSVGIGFLYMKDMMGLLRRRSFFDTNFDANYGKLHRKIAYNRTPLFEYLIGYRVLSWLRPSFSYQYQTGVSIQTERVLSNRTGLGYLKLFSNLNLNTVMLKLYFQLPWPLIFKNEALSLFSAVGVGPSWQNWNQIRLVMSQIPTGGGGYLQSKPIPLRQITCANASLNVDIGLKLQSAFPNSPYNVQLGVKYNYWGQARNIGDWTQQDSIKVNNQLFSIKRIYQFAPYIGFQWVFLPSCVDQVPYMVNGRIANTIKPFFVNTKYLGFKNWKWTQFNVGIGFLYFSGVQGNFMILPSNHITSPAVSGFVSAPMKRRLTYNRTPLFEYLLGTQINSWLKLGLSYQHQSSVNIQTQALSVDRVNTTTQFAGRAIFNSGLALDALMAKFYCLAPVAIVWKSIAFNPYLALGVGPCWQSWTNPNIIFLRRFANTTGIANQVNLRNEYSANCGWMFDIGINSRSAKPQASFSIWTGIKYNQWGQAKNIGAQKKHGTLTYGIFKPFRIQTIYQWAPYLGVQWNF